MSKKIKEKIYMIGESLSYIIEKIKDFKHWFRLSTYDRFDIVKCNDLKRGCYYDIDDRMLHACFSLLEDFMRYEFKWEHISESEHKNVELKMVELLHWWKYTRQKNFDKDLTEGIKIPDSKWIPSKRYTGLYENVEIDSIDIREKYHNAAMEQFKYENKLYNEDKEKLKQLIDIMDYLWS